MIQTVRMQKDTDLDRIVKKTFESKSKLDQRLASIIRGSNTTEEIFQEMNQPVDLDCRDESRAQLPESRMAPEHNAAYDVSEIDNDDK